LLWTLIPTTIALIVVQEMAARMGAVTGKGLHDLIREEFGIRATFFVSFVFGLADLGNISSPNSQDWRQAWGKLLGTILPL
jgi:Mn2+/Fe2+ NRAMP family transporter